MSLPIYLEAHGLDDNSETRRAYSLARLPSNRRSGILPMAVTAGWFEANHWRWTEAQDVVYSYERNAPGSWLGVMPQQVFVTRFPGGRELRKVRFSTTAARAYFRLRADIGG